MVWPDYADFILISVYMHPQTYAVHASVPSPVLYVDITFYMEPWLKRGQGMGDSGGKTPTFAWAHI